MSQGKYENWQNGEKCGITNGRTILKLANFWILILVSQFVKFRKVRKFYNSKNFPNYSISKISKFSKFDTFYNCRNSQNIQVGKLSFILSVRMIWIKNKFENKKSNNSFHYYFIIRNLEIRNIGRSIFGYSKFLPSSKYICQ